MRRDPSARVVNAQGETVARAKRTARAEARRRYRAGQDLGEANETEIETASPRATGSQPPIGARPAGRVGIFTAFRMAFRPLDVRGDLRSLPSIAIHSKALWVP